jgi:hypothetical protein
VQTPGAATRQLQWLKEDGQDPARLKRMQLSPNCSSARPAPSVLFVGPERKDEFSHALRLTCQGRDVIAINPRETAAARAFHRTGGRFIRARIEDLAPEPYRFDFVYENYPYPWDEI